MTELTLIVDNLAAKSEVAGYLREKGIGITESFLKGGQYRITDDCVILHLTTEEFHKQITDKTLYRRILELKRFVPEPIMIIEGDPCDAPEHTTLIALRTALSFITMHNRVPILPAKGPRDVAEMIFTMANQAQKGMGHTLTDGGPEPEAVGATKKKKAEDNGSVPTESEDLQEYIVCALPDVTPVSAKALIKKFKSLKAVFSATTKELTECKGIGPKKAKKIAAFLAEKHG